jgi:hypothetical protein
MRSCAAAAVLGDVGDPVAAAHRRVVRDAAVMLVALPSDDVATVAAARDGKIVIDATSNPAAAQPVPSVDTCLQGVNLRRSA